MSSEAAAVRSANVYVPGVHVGVKARK
jgi:hypothetical protein